MKLYNFAGPENSTKRYKPLSVPREYGATSRPYRNCSVGLPPGA